MKRLLFWSLFLGLFAGMMSSCATIISGGGQRIPIITNPAGAKVTVGGITQMTPCTILLARNKGAQQVIIEKLGYAPVTVTLKKTINGWVFGNIVFGGLIGLVIDIGSGNASAFTPKEIDISLIKRLESGLTGKDILVVKIIE